LREVGVDSLVIKELMGHESLATTAIYVDVPMRQRSAAVILLPKMTRRVPQDGTLCGLDQLSLFD
jgi:integrase